MKSREGVLLGLVTILASEPLTRATSSGVVGDSNGDRSEIQMDKLCRALQAYVLCVKHSIHSTGIGKSLGTLVLECCRHVEAGGIACFTKPHTKTVVNLCT